MPISLKHPFSLLCAFSLSSFALPQPTFFDPDAPAYQQTLWNGSADNEELAKFHNTNQVAINTLIKFEAGRINQTEAQMFPRPAQELQDRSLFVMDALKNYEAFYKSRRDLAAALSRDLNLPPYQILVMLADYDVLKKSPGLKLQANCYTYFIDGNNPVIIRDARHFQETIDIYDPATYDAFVQETIKGSIEDGLIFTGQTLRQREGFYNGALFVRLAIKGAKNMYETHEYHYLRQNPDGSWSHKYSTLNVTDVDFSGRKITDPKTADFGPYKFIGYFEAPKGGLSASLPIITVAAPKPH